jgi:hypothetical protein
MVPLPTRFAGSEEQVTYDPVPDGHLAAVVTFLEMRERPLAPVPPSSF